MRLLYHIALKNITRKKVYSYGKFLKENPKTTKKNRIKALKKFLNSTR